MSLPLHAHRRTVPTPFSPFPLSLQLAEHEMPGLMISRKEYKGALAGA